MEVKKIKLSPYQIHRNKLDEVCGKYFDDQKKYAHYLVQGIGNDDDEDEDIFGDDDEQENKKELDLDTLTQEQVDKLRLIILTPNRKKLLKKASSFVSGGQSDEGFGFMMFSTSSGNNVILELSSKIKSAMNSKTLDKKFDALFALTAALLDYDSWVYDNECWGEGGKV